MVDLRLMIPESRTALPRHEVSLDGVVIGWVQFHRIGRSTRDFYKAHGIHPGNGKIVNLENHPSMEEAVRTLEEFHEYPDRFSRHFL